MIDKREITPELLVRLTVMLFTRMPIRDVLEERILFSKLSCDDIARLMKKEPYFAQAQSLDGMESYARTVIDYVNKRTHWQNGAAVQDQDLLNVFDLLMLTLQDLLIMNHNHMECRYEEILSWRWLVRYMGEELALSARYAMWDHTHHKPHRQRFDDFTWSYVTSHNNKQLHMITQRGISEHHCHLWASTPFFHVSWVNLMNHLTDSVYQHNLRKLSPQPWSAEQIHRRLRGDFSDDVKPYYGVLAQTRAAWIRLYLCRRISGRDMRRRFAHDLWNVRNYDNWRELLLSHKRLQSEIDSYAYMADGFLDYALAIAKLQKPVVATDYHALIGERWLYYEIFRDYCRPPQQRVMSPEDYNLFFVYFRLRLWIRKKMVQINDYIGFDNFQQIERRKAFFLADRKSERALTRLAVNDSLKKDYVRELEVRIKPDEEQLRRLEAAINSDSTEDPVAQYLARQAAARGWPAYLRQEEELAKRYYYVFHFLKRRDPDSEAGTEQKHSAVCARVCRHNELRRQIMEQAKTIIRFRERNPGLAKRVLGIDAASWELRCRPEVFGSVYRLLGDHQFFYGGYSDEKQKIPALGKTYHVGEEFADIVDGLRAIDEVINFLDFDCGDRLGHAMALGVNVEAWYERKHREISISVQDYLDNLAWLNHALNHFRIPNYNSLKERIKKEFEYWFNIVYRNSIQEDQIAALMDLACAWYRTSKEDHGLYRKHICHFDIMTYYRAWMLRGDDPYCYVDGFFKKPKDYIRMAPEVQCKICWNYPPRFEERYISEYSLLNYLYQFNPHVRQEGARRIKVDISDEYIRAVKAVQIAMRYRIERKGIAIESNLTSNVLIGTFREYSKHPILAFNNRGLPVSEAEEEECAQLQVSINTDDRGVFYTDLETEYALLARSVEQICDENEKQRFKKNDIYTWLDNIRMMGNDQSFRDREDRSV